MPLRDIIVLYIFVQVRIVLVIGFLYTRWWVNERIDNFFYRRFGLPRDNRKYWWRPW